MYILCVCTAFGFIRPVIPRFKDLSMAGGILISGITGRAGRDRQNRVPAIDEAKEVVK